jgi:hypothetical protein
VPGEKEATCCNWVCWYERSKREIPGTAASVGHPVCTSSGGTRVKSNGAIMRGGGGRRVLSEINLPHFHFVDKVCPEIEPETLWSKTVNILDQWDLIKATVGISKLRSY